MGLNQFGYETTLVVGSPEHSEGSLDDWARSRGAKLHVLPTFQAAISPLKDLVTLCKLWVLFRRERPDIVHTHTFKAGLVGRLAALLAGVPQMVHTYHGHLLSGYWSGTKTRLVIWAERGLAFFTDRLIAVSPRVGQDLVDAKIARPEQLEIVELGFDIADIERQTALPARLRDDLGLDEGALLVGIVGRLVPVKAVDLFLRAMAPLFAKYPQLHVAVLGDGTERQKLESLAREISPRIHFTGWRRPVVSDLSDLDLCVCSSRNEGTSVSIIEAVIAGVPVISTRVGGMGDLLGQGRWGKLVDFGELPLRVGIEEMIRVLTDPSDTACQKLVQQTSFASEFFKNRFSVERLLQNIDTIYLNLSGRPVSLARPISLKN